MLMAFVVPANSKTKHGELYGPFADYPEAEQFKDAVMAGDPNAFVLILSAQPASAYEPPPTYED